MGVTNHLESLISAFIASEGAAWLALFGGGTIYPPDSIPDCAAGSVAYGMFEWVGVKDIRTASELRDEYWIQFLLYSDDRALLNDIWDGCFDLLDSTWYDLKDIGYNIRLWKDRGAPGIPPTKTNKKDRLSKFMAMAQFRLYVQKRCILT